MNSKELDSIEDVLIAAVKDATSRGDWADVEKLVSQLNEVQRLIERDMLRSTAQWPEDQDEDAMQALRNRDRRGGGRKRKSKKRKSKKKRSKRKSKRKSKKKRQ